jgi:hypothetical protein
MLPIFVWFGDVAHFSEIGLIWQLDTDYNIWDFLHVAHSTKINVTDFGLVWQYGAYFRRLFGLEVW